jgi:hypothetical protein
VPHDIYLLKAAPVTVRKKPHRGRNKLQCRVAINLAARSEPSRGPLLRIFALRYRSLKVVGSNLPEIDLTYVGGMGSRSARRASSLTLV